MDNAGRSYRTKQGNWERGAAATDKAENWRANDQFRGQNMRPEGGQQGKKNQGGPYKASPKKGGLGPLSYSPGGYRGGHSPLQRDDQWFTGFENSCLNQEDNWRGRTQQPWRRTTQGEVLTENMDQGRRDAADAHKQGNRRRNRKTKNALAKEDRSLGNEESTSSFEDRQNVQQAEKQLLKEEIYFLKRKPHNNPGAFYTCALCDVTLDSIPHAYKHIRDKRHKKKARQKQEQLMLTEIQPPGPEQISAVTAALEAVVQEHGLNDQDVEKRRCVVSLMQNLLLSVLPEIRLRPYGSSCTKFGFKDSDVNIDIQYPPHMHQPDVLLLVKDCLSVSPLFINVEADFHARVPVVMCTDKMSGLICKVSAGNDNAFQTTTYLSSLADREPLLHPLVVGLRRWAQICEIDRAEEGGLPTYVFGLMVIYFLQKRREPLLPTYLNQELKVFSLSKLPDFNLTHAEEGYLHWSYTPSSKEPPQQAGSSCLDGKVPLVFPNSHPAVEIGRLWIEMLRFYSLEFKMDDYVISVRTGAVLSRDMKDWPKRRIAVEDPFAVKRNVARSLSSQQMYDYIFHCLKSTYKYFALPPNTPAAHRKRETKQGQTPGTMPDAPSEDPACLSDFSQLSLQSKTTRPAMENGPDDSDCIIEDEEEIEECSDSDEEREKEKVDPGKSSLSEEDEDEEEDVDVDTHGRQHLDSFTTEEEDIFQVDEISGEDLLSDEEAPDLDTPGLLDEEEEVELEPGPSKKSPEEEKPPKQTRSAYEFTRQAFTRGKSHTVVCSLCKRDGHLKKDCPEDFKKVELEPLPPMTPEFLRVLNSVCEQCYTDFAPDELEQDVKESILQDLETFVRKQFSGARLQLFGSSKNGFGFRMSDLDICMMLEGRDNMHNSDCTNIIKGLARHLKKHPALRNILPITTAKVPIVKFLHRSSSLEGDISLYNTLGLHNTHLLATYAAIDARVKILCCAMKIFAKTCDIGDASRGSLSSYAYTLMVLFFLQQRNPPVIPVLQEIYNGKKKPEVLVDGWNVYFHDDLKTLPSVWPEYRKNTETVGELWLGLLRFYTEDFDFKEHVVCIRQHACLTTFNKQWTSKYIVIEDPFDLNHNLGAGLSRKMTNFIMKAFINGRRLFGTPVKMRLPISPSVMEYFFDAAVLTGGELAPNDRCCRICGKIGHYMKECPMRKKGRHRRDSENLQDSGEEGKDQVRPKNESWRKRDPAEMRCCFLCGSTSHIKRDCQLNRVPAGFQKGNVKMERFAPPTAAQPKNLREKEKQGLTLQEEKRGRKQQNVILSPQAGSLACRNATRPGHRKSPVE
uniref:Zinc finger, CCHC domain containing 6 n=1 Tax=Iconisemion striatum TaxID=60296 RepID=A0A1A7WHH6_9TELE